MKSKYLTFLASVVVLTGCVVSEEIPMKTAFGVPDGTVEYAPVVGAENLSLRMLNDDIFYCGEKSSLVFAIMNTGNLGVSIQEWYAFESDNIRVFVQPWFNGTDKPDPNGWTELSFDLKQPIMHYPLILLPGNQVMVSKELPFIEKLQVSPGKERRFFVRAETSLKSLKLTTDIRVIRVLSGK